LADRFADVDLGWLRLGGVKLFLDGGLTAAAAAMHEPYPHLPGYRGELAFSPDELRERIEELDQAGHQIMVHAIGDRALDEVLDAFERLPGRRPVESGMHRIEHGGNLFMTTERIERFKRAGVLPIPQPSFIYSTASGYRRFLGPERSRDLMPFRKLLDAGLAVPGNSDSAGVEARMHEPMFGIWCLVNRRANTGEVLDIEQAVTVKEGLRMYTRNAALSLGELDNRGSLEVGKFADFVVLDRDPGAMPADQLLEVAVDSTWVGGRCRYDRASAATGSA
jgi:predicted amidohydrolase YtcJ